MKKNITKEEEKALLEIAKRLMAAVDNRGDLEARDNDSEDFIEVPVWGIQKAMEEMSKWTGMRAASSIISTTHTRMKFRESRTRTSTSAGTRSFMYRDLDSMV